MKRGCYIRTEEIKEKMRKKATGRRFHWSEKTKKKLREDRKRRQSEGETR